MAKTITSSKRRTVEFLGSRLGPWAQHAGLLHFSDEDLAEITAAYQAAREALRQAELAREKAIAATARFDALGERAEAVARKAVRRIRFTASASADPAGVYAAGRIDPPEKPGPKKTTPTPAVPSELTVSLDTQGRAVVGFAASRRGGAAFEIERQVEDVGPHGRRRTGPWERAGVTLERPFVDEATPRGVATIWYRVRAVRPGATSAWSAPAGLPMGVEVRCASA